MTSGTDDDISGETASTYTLVAADEGKTIKVKVSFQDAGGGSEGPFTSAATAVVAAANTPPTASNGEVTATEDTDYTFTAANFNFSDTDVADTLSSVKITSLPASGKGTLEVDGTVIASGALPKAVTKVDIDASKLTYVPPDNADGDDYATFQFKVNDGTDDSAAPYTMTIDVTAVNDAATGQPGITGTAQVGQVLTAAAGTIADPDGLPEPFLTDANTSFQWVRVTSGTDDDISGETASTYTLVAADEGKTIKVKVSFQDAGGGSEGPFTSAATAVVAAANTPPTASNGEVTATEDTDYTFTAANFNFSDTDVADTLSSVKITSLPASGTGTLEVDGTVIASGALPKAVTKVDIDASKLTYVPPDNADGDDYATFQFKVNDGTDDSAAPYTMTIGVTAVNDAATGQPGITGTAQVGQVLTAAAGTIADPDGLPEPFLTDTNTSFQWVRVTSGTDDDISGETASTYTLVAADEGKTIKVKVSFQDAGGGSEGPFTSAATAVVAAANTPPTASNGEVTATEDTDYTFTAANFNFSDTDVADTLSSVKITSLPASGKGTLEVDGTVIASGALPKAVTKVDIDASKLTYVPPDNADGDDYATFQFKVNDGTDDSAAPYTMTIDVTAVNDAATGQPGITGTAQVGQVLTAAAGTIADPDGLPEPFLTDANTSFQWVRVTSGTDDDISGETASTYTLVAADEGKTIKVKVSFQDAGGGSEGPFTSAATAVVAAADTTPPTVSTAATSAIGGQIQFRFSEDPQTSNLPPTSAFDVTVDGIPHAISDSLSVLSGLLFFTVSPSIRQGQTVVVTYTDPTGGNDARAIQDAAGNDVATFTTGQNSVPAVTNRSSVVPTAPGAPTGLTATASGSTQIDLSWTAPANYGGRVITGYKIEISPNGTDTWTDRVATTGDANTTYAHTGLAAGTTRHYRVSAINTIGTGTASNVDDATTTADTTPPTLISADVPNSGFGLTIFMTFDELLARPSEGVLSAAVLAAFTVTADGVEVGLSHGATQGTAFINLQARASSRIRQGQTVVVTYTDPTDGNDADAVQDPAGNDVATFTTGQNSVPAVTNSSTVVPTAPGAPTGLTATASGTTQIDLSWTVPADNGGRVITGYKIEISPNGTDTWTTHLATTGDANTTYAHTGLAAGTTRHYRVSAINTIGPGTASNVDDATTTASSNTAATGAPTISGTARVGQTLTAVTTGIRDDDGLTNVSYTYQWIRVDGGNETDIGSATASTYTLVDDDQGKTIKVKVSFTDDANNAETLTSAATAVVSAASNTAATGAPTISGTAQVGQTLTAVTTGIRDTDGLNNVSYTYQWIRVDGGSDSDISGETARTYTLVDDDRGKTIKVKVSFRDDANNAETLTSAATGVVAAPPNTDPPTVSIIDPWSHVLTVCEDVGRAELTVSLDRPVASDLSVFWSTEDDNAKAPDDYIARNRAALIFPAGETLGTISIRIVDDAVPEDTVRGGKWDVFFVEAERGPGYRWENGSLTIVEIVDDDVDYGCGNGSSGDAANDALALVDGVTPEVAAAVLLGEQTLSEAQLAALDRLGNRNGRYDIGDLLSWIARCGRDEVRCGGPASATGAGSLPASPAMPPTKPHSRTPPRRRGDGRAGRRSGRNMGGSAERVPQRRAMRSGVGRGPGRRSPAIRRAAGWIRALALGLVVSAWGCGIGDNPVQPAQPDPGPLYVQLTVPPQARDIGAMLVVEGPGIDSLSAPGFELIQADAASSNRREAIIAGSLSTGPVLQVWVPDRHQLGDYRVTLMQVSGDDYGLKDPTQYGIVISR